jgi:hypothetical protein
MVSHHAGSHPVASEVTSQMVWHARVRLPPKRSGTGRTLGAEPELQRTDPAGDVPDTVSELYAADNYLCQPFLVALMHPTSAWKYGSQKFAL